MPEQTKLLKLPEDWNKMMAIVAHPDDLEFGASSAIARWTDQGKEVIYLMVTRGEAGIDSLSPEEAGPLREQEQIKSAKVVGVDIVEFLDHVDGVIQYGSDLRRDISRAIRKHKPDVILSGNHELTWGSETFNMADHRWVGLAVLDAARDAGNRWIFPELVTEGFKPWNGVKKIFIGHPPQPTYYVDVTDYIDKGVASLKEHKVYIENLSGGFDPESFLTFGAAAVGEQAGCDYAVSFSILNL